MTLKENINPKISDSAKITDEVFARRFPMSDNVSELVIAVAPDDFSASRIAHAVEDCNAHLVNLNLTSERTPNGFLIVDLRVSHRNGQKVARALERYGFDVLEINSADNDELDAARLRAEELLRILEI